MPYPNEHAARQRSPSGFQRMRRTHPKGWPDGVDAIWGIRSDGTEVIQSIRFDRTKWTPAAAKAWLKKGGFTSAGFEVATGKRAPETGGGGAYGDDGQRFEVRCRIVKVDKFEKKIFGWLYISKDINGEQVVDHSGEIIRTIELERASYKYVHEHRKMGDLHRRDAKGEVIQAGYLIEAVVFTPEKRAAMCTSLGLPGNKLEGILPDGLWVGYQITDAETWADVLSGKKRDLSLGGRASKVPVTGAAA